MFHLSQFWTTTLCGQQREGGEKKNSKENKVCSRWHLNARERPHALHSDSQKFSQCRLWNSFNAGSVENCPTTPFEGRALTVALFSSSFFLFFFFFCDSLLMALNKVVCLTVLASSVSSSSTFQIFQDASHLWRLLCPPHFLFGHFPSTWF